MSVIEPEAHLHIVHSRTDNQPSRNTIDQFI
jgi:hypothetical protein